MKLQVKKNQRDVKGLLGGHKGVKFELSVVAEMTDEERKLAAQYLVGAQHLYTWEFVPSKGAAPTLRFISVDSLVKGQSFECESLSDILDLEENIVSAANKLHNYLAVARTFGGTTIVNIPTES